jgi:hypothetical protein
MERRTYLRMVPVSILLASGCGSDRHPSGSGTDNQTIVEYSVTISDPDPSLLNRYPIAEFDAEATIVTLRGTLPVGSSKCKTTELQSIDYDSSTDTLLIEVTHTKIDNHPDNNFWSGSCPDDMSIDEYNIVVTFRSELPETVTVIEHNVPGGVPQEKETQTITLHQ